MEDVPSQNVPMKIHPFLLILLTMASHCSFQRNGSMAWPYRTPRSPVLARLSVCFVRSFAIMGIRQGGYTAAQEKSTPKFHTISWNKSGGGSRAAYLPSAHMGKSKTCLQPTESRSQEPLIHAGQTRSHNRVQLLIFCHNSSRDTKLHRTERCWALQAKLRHLNLMGFFPAFSHSLQYCYSDAQHQRI